MNATVELVEELLKLEERSGPVTSRADLALHRGRRAELSTLIAQLSSQVNTLHARQRHLPALPDLEHMIWAEAILLFPNLAFLVLDTTGTESNADIIRVLLASGEGQVLHDWHVRPSRQIGYANSSYTGIPRETILESKTLPEIWDQIRVALAGHYIISYHLEFVKVRLSENIQHYGLTPIPIIGECLMERAKLYYGVYSYLKLSDVCAKVGHILPAIAAAPDRAAGQAAFLRAMAEGVTNIGQASVTDDDVLASLDEHPF